MICAWEHLKPLGIRQALLHCGFLREHQTMLACDKQVKLIYRACSRTPVGVIRAWLKRFDARTPVYMGSHARIVEKAPVHLFNEARSLQGNAKIRGWTAAARRGHVRVLDPYNLTAGLTPAYRDSYDGLHFGYFVNLQKFRMVLGALQFLPGSPPSAPVLAPSPPSAP